MVTLLHNRRKYTSGQSSPTAGGVWADFNLSHMGGHVRSTQLVDSASSYLSGQPLRCYGLTPMPNGNLLISADGQGHSYVWGFTSGHSMELEYIDNFYTSRTGSFSGFYAITFTGDGTGFYRQSGGVSTIYYQPLGSPYNLGTAGSSTAVFSSVSQGIVGVPYYISVSSDGKTLIYKTSTSLLYGVSFDTAWPTSAFDRWSMKSINLSSFDSFMISSGTNTWNGFTVSPDGKCIVATTNQTVVKFALSTPWDVSTMSFHSFKNLLDDVRSISGDSNVSVTLTGVAVNAAGTKMLVHNRAGGTTAKCRFFEYDLVA